MQQTFCISSPPTNYSLLFLKSVDAMKPRKCLQLFSCVSSFSVMSTPASRALTRSFLDRLTNLLFPVAWSFLWASLCWAERYHGPESSDKKIIDWVSHSTALVSLCQDNLLLPALFCFSILAVPHHRFGTCVLHSRRRLDCVHGPGYDQTRKWSHTHGTEFARSQRHLQTVSSCDSCSNNLRCWLQCRGTLQRVIRSTEVFLSISESQLQLVCQGKSCVLLTLHCWHSLTLLLSSLARSQTVSPQRQRACSHLL